MTFKRIAHQLRKLVDDDEFTNAVDDRMCRYSTMYEREEWIRIQNHRGMMAKLYVQAIADVLKQRAEATETKAGT